MRWLDKPYHSLDYDLKKKYGDFASPIARSISEQLDEGRSYFHEKKTGQQAAARLHAAHIPVIAHMILGLPDEDKEMMLETCRYLNACHVDGVKLQLLHVLRGTPLAELYAQGAFETLSLEAYLDIVISCLELLSPDITIHRLTGDGPKPLLIAPTWSLNKRNVLNTLHREMRLRDTWQGKYFDNKEVIF